jgi:hypothetical protein
MTDAPQIMAHSPANVQPYSEWNGLAAGILLASFFNQEEQQRARRLLLQHDCAIIEVGKSNLLIDLRSSPNPGQMVSLLLAQPGLRGLEEQSIHRTFCNVAREIIGQNIVTSKPGISPGLTGKGEIVAVADSGLDTGDVRTIHPDFKGRVRAIQTFPPGRAWQARIVDQDQKSSAADEYNGHGTLLCGCILGNGTLSIANGDGPHIMGMAPEAELVFQALERKVEWNELGKDWWRNVKHRPDPPVYHYVSIPDNLQELFQAAYDQNARIHLIAWGGGKPGAYDMNSRNLDQFMWDHKDFLIVVAAGNTAQPVLHPRVGRDVIAPGSISSPATAKNCLTVGASENERPTIEKNNGATAAELQAGEIRIPLRHYGDQPDHKWPNDPFRQDGVVDRKDDIAAMSSRGPTADGRRKPDVVAPGTFVLSARSRRLPPDEYGDLKELGKYSPAAQDYMFGLGTSISAALVAGCAALVRQYLRENQGIPNPSAALVKAVLIHAAQYQPYRFRHPDSSKPADNEQGWGRIDLQAVLLTPSPLAFVEKPGKTVLFYDDIEGLAQHEHHDVYIEIRNSMIPLRVTLVYTDRPGRTLINNLNLLAFDPDGTPFVGNDITGSGTPDTVNNVEGIIVEKPKEGKWKIQVLASDLPEGGVQAFALVITGGGVREDYKLLTEKAASTASIEVDASSASGVALNFPDLVKEQ